MTAMCRDQYQRTYTTRGELTFVFVYPPLQIQVLARVQRRPGRERRDDRRRRRCRGLLRRDRESPTVTQLYLSEDPPALHLLQFNWRFAAVYLLRFGSPDNTRDPISMRCHTMRRIIPILKPNLGLSLAHAELTSNLFSPRGVRTAVSGEGCFEHGQLLRADPRPLPPLFGLFSGVVIFFRKALRRRSDARGRGRVRRRRGGGCSRRRRDGVSTERLWGRGPLLGSCKDPK